MTDNPKNNRLDFLRLYSQRMSSRMSIIPKRQRQQITRQQWKAASKLDKNNLLFNKAILEGLKIPRHYLQILEKAEKYLHQHLKELSIPYSSATIALDTDKALKEIYQRLPNSKYRGTGIHLFCRIFVETSYIDPPYPKTKTFEESMIIFTKIKDYDLESTVTYNVKLIAQKYSEFWSAFWVNVCGASLDRLPAITTEIPFIYRNFLQHSTNHISDIRSFRVTPSICPKIEPSKQGQCQECKHYFGENNITCGIHPHGPQEPQCPDQEKPIPHTKTIKIGDRVALTENCHHLHKGQVGEVTAILENDDFGTKSVKFEIKFECDRGNLKPQTSWLHLERSELLLLRF